MAFNKYKFSVGLLCASQYVKHQTWCELGCNPVS